MAAQVCPSVTDRSTRGTPSSDLGERAPLLGSMGEGYKEVKRDRRD